MTYMLSVHLSTNPGLEEHTQIRTLPSMAPLTFTNAGARPATRT